MKESCPSSADINVDSLTNKVSLSSGYLIIFYK